MGILYIMVIVCILKTGKTRRRIFPVLILNETSDYLDFDKPTRE